MTDTSEVTDAAPPVEGVPVTINGVDVVARKGELLIDAAERHGVYIPRFCYHPRMKPVGMCRMCIAEVDTGRGPALQPTCMLECTPGMKVDTESKVTRKAQDGVLEFLLINHPLDCPVCDKGGECPLQDQTMAYGPGESRFVEEKRHKEKPIPISDLVLLDRERCILCDRCTRFAKDVAGDPLIHFINRGGNTEINTFPDHPFASYFSGNTVQICPVGALTGSTYRFKARPWDLDQRESTCQTCAVGCRVAVQSSRNEVLRYLGVDVDPVNWGWLCDKGRFNFQYVNNEDRLRAPLMNVKGTLTEVSWGSALRAAANAVRTTVDARGAESVAVLGGARLTNEDNYAWAKLAKGVIGTDNVDAQLDDGLPAELVLGLPQATIDEVCAAGGVVIVATADIKEELPVLFLRLRHAVLNDGVKLIELTPQHTGLSELATVSLRHRPGEVAHVVRALLDGPLPASAPPGHDGGGVDRDGLAAAQRLLQAADRPVTAIVGRQSLAESSEFITDAAGALLSGLPGITFLPAVRRGNVRGALDMGMTPGFLPGRTTLDTSRAAFEKVWPGLPAQRGLDAPGILSAAAAGAIDVLILVGSDPLGDFVDTDLARRALTNVDTIIAVDLFLNESTKMATIVLPAAGFTEKDGTTTNFEGRVSVVTQKVTPPGTARADWMIAAELAHLLGSDLRLESPAQIWHEITTLAPSHLGLTVEHERELRFDGVVVPLPSRGGEPAGEHRPPSADDKPAPDVAATVDAAQAELVDDTLAVAAEGAVPEGTPAEVAEQSGTSTGPVRPPLHPDIYVFAPGDPTVPPANDAYGLRLVLSRKLFDQGTLTQHTPGLANLAPGTILRVSASDFDRLGVTSGDRVRVKSPKGELTTEIVRDAGLPRGTAAAYVNQPGLAVHELIDASHRVTHLRIDSGGVA